MKFSELVRLLKDHGFGLVKEKGSIRYYGKAGWPRLVRVDYHGAKEVPTGTGHSESRRDRKALRTASMINLPYSLVIEANEDPSFFGFYSPDLEGFTGVGHSVEDCLYKARHGMQEHVSILTEQGLAVPPADPNATVVIRNEKAPEAQPVH